MMAWQSRPRAILEAILGVPQEGAQESTAKREQLAALGREVLTLGERAQSLAAGLDGEWKDLRRALAAVTAVGRRSPLPTTKGQQRPSSRRAGRLLDGRVVPEELLCAEMVQLALQASQMATTVDDTIAVALLATAGDLLRAASLVLQALIQPDGED